MAVHDACVMRGVYAYTLKHKHVHIVQVSAQVRGLVDLNEVHVMYT